MKKILVVLVIVMIHVSALAGERRSGEGDINPSGGESAVLKTAAYNATETEPGNEGKGLSKEGQNAVEAASVVYKEILPIFLKVVENRE